VAQLERPDSPGDLESHAAAETAASNHDAPLVRASPRRPWRA
jgi:hypothetical protein